MASSSTASSILAAGATPVVVPERNYKADVDAILAKVTARTKIVFLANPNNPTGTYLAIDEVRRLREGLPGDVLLVLDAAYAEYVRRNDYEAGLELVATTENTVMTRTFSKIFGLAGLRIGWAYCPGRDRRRAQPHPRAVQPLRAGDCRRRRGDRGPDSRGTGGAPQRDVAAVARSRGREARPRGDAESSPTSCSSISRRTAARGAVACDELLKSRGIIVRRVAGYGLPDALRVTVGTEDENRKVVAALAAFTGKAAQ